MPEASDKRRLTREEWFANREAKRAKQREQNIYCAAKMHAARLAHVADHGEEKNAPAPAESKPGVRVGCSGWFYWHWRACFYSSNNDREGDAIKNARELMRQLKAAGIEPRPGGSA